ncbi:dihydropteroate synthase [Lentiprolixibacter aurantiacus]|uniref:Dihydropteroate synthase n=1 Tax=Lentiprolixibacter aurantiacus TaxID=2993939 RepID=A0AAE3MMH7_9FLAO|nr:dihydropteroate synthase [Lentiprolixibacter aurantiacus]MCX2720565.1 dihydropteroate synthase [Lentiprolixibacter aurantiacus]
MTLNCKGQLISLEPPLVMGILNITPDSFYDGGRYQQPKQVLNQTEKMLREGAAFIDVGAYSSRPGADQVPEEEELSRILPIVELLLKEFPEILLSIDTFRSSVARECIAAGAAMINDISAGNMDPNMMETMGRLKVPYIMMHMRGTPQTMKNLTDYENLLESVMYYFSEKIALAREAGIVDLILDPGFGFAKTLEQNYELLRNLSLLKQLDYPLLVGVSRKSMIYKLLGLSPEQALNGTTALHMYSLSRGASILRAHDVKEAVECVRLHQQLSE